jgi:hypothetical protein
MKIPSGAPLYIGRIKLNHDSLSDLFSVVCFIIGVCLFIYIVWYVRKWMLVRKWDCVVAILNCSTSDKCINNISYKYDFLGCSYISRLMSINSCGRRDKIHPKSYEKIIFAGKNNGEITVYVNPENPNQAYQDVEFDKITVLICVIFMLIGFLLCIFLAVNNNM